MRSRGFLVAVGKGRGRQGYMTVAALVISNNRTLSSSFVGSRLIVAGDKKPHPSYHLPPPLLLLPQSRGYNFRGVMSSSSPPSVSSRKKAEEEMQKKGVEEEKPVPESPCPLPPPPPEKPLPGDCCGSGCVRCVWDVYYDELEAYNKLLSTTQSEIKKPS